MSDTIVSVVHVGASAYGETTAHIPWGYGVLMSGAFIALLVILYKKSEAGRKRRADPQRVVAIRALVAEKGWGYAAEDAARAKYFTAYPFSPPGGQRPSDIVWGHVDGRPFETFALNLAEDSYMSGSLGDRRTLSSDFQVTWVPLAGPLPRIKFTLNNSTTQRLAALGEHEVDVESHEFNEIWRVYSHDDRIAHAVLQPRMIERLLQPDARSREFAFEGRALMTSVPYATDLSDLESLVRTLHEIAELVPSFLFQGP